MKLSLCINTFNEEKNIHLPLDSAIDLVDEVIIIDGSSKDKTVVIAKSYGAKVKTFVVDNPRNFLTNKQRAIERASGEWILQLDADEALSEDLKKEIATLLNCYIAKRQPNNETMKQCNNKFIGYNIPRKNFFLTRFLMKGGVYPDYVLRLYKKKNAKFDLKDLHENVKVSGEIGYFKNPILHYADPNFSRYLLRWDRYTTFDAENLHQRFKVQSSMFKVFLMFIDYFFCKPVYWFLKTYFRHLGLMDGFPGFVFSLFSAIRFWVIYIKWYSLRNNK